MKEETQRGAPSGVAPEFLNEAGMGGGFDGLGGGGGGGAAVVSTKKLPPGTVAGRQSVAEGGALGN